MAPLVVWFAMGMDSEAPQASGRGQRCQRHALAAGPDGMCALCRSESLPPARPYPAWVLGGILAATLLVSGAALAYRAFQNLAIPSSAPFEAGSITPAAESITVEPTVRDAIAEAPLERGGIPATGESVPLAVPQPAPAVTGSEPAPTAAAPATPAPSRPPPSEAELRAALSATPIVMYATSWCGVCRKARQFLNANGFKYQEIDADQTPGAWDKVQQLGGRRAVPVIVVDGEVSVGLNTDRIMKAAASSMERRLGITGIRFRSN
jgi:mycoredoxin